jgi:hypothetical protein
VQAQADARRGRRRVARLSVEHAGLRQSETRMAHSNRSDPCERGFIGLVPILIALGRAAAHGHAFLDHSSPLRQHGARPRRTRSPFRSRKTSSWFLSSLQVTDAKGA